MTENPRFLTGNRVRAAIGMLAAVSAIGSMAIHMVVPALPSIAEDFSIDAHGAQQIVSFYLYGLAIGQLIAGPLVDRIGKRTVLVCGLILYAAAALAGSVATAPLQLLFIRVLQAFGASAGIVTARVLVGDLFDRAEASRRQATLMAVVLLSPAIAPVIGGIIVQNFGWRNVFALLGVISLVILALSWKFLPFTPRRTAKPQAERHLLRDFGSVLRNRRFLRTAIALAGSSSALFMFLSAAPFLLISRWGLTAEQAGYCLLAPACAGIVGTFFVGRLGKRIDTLRTGLTLTLLGSALLLVLALSGYGGWPALILPVCLAMLGAGMTGPSGITIIIYAEEDLSGTAVSLAGAIQMASSGMASGGLSLFGAPSFLLLGLGMTAAGLIALTAAPRLIAAH